MVHAYTSVPPHYGSLSLPPLATFFVCCPADQCMELHFKHVEQGILIWSGQEGMPGTHCCARMFKFQEKGISW